MELSQNSDYSIVSDSEAASIICRFTPEMIQDIVEDAIANKYRSYSSVLANIVHSIEQNYQLARNGLPEYSNEITSQRFDIYMQISNLVCAKHGLQIRTDQITDIYSAAYYIYDFLIAQFNTHMINFFVNYINREKNMIYETLELAAKKKDASAYSKRLFRNSIAKLATIHANLEFVIANICEYDIDFNQYIELACIPDRIRGQVLQMLLVDTGDFFKRLIVPYYQSNYAELTTQIKFALQGLATAEFSDLA